MSGMMHFDTQDAKPVRSSYTTARIVIYSIFLSLAIVQTAFFCITMLAFDPMWITITSIASLVVASLSFIWVSVLLAYTNRPLSKHILCRAKAHHVSFIVLAVVWLGPSILSAISSSIVCDPLNVDSWDSFWCSFTLTECVLGFSLSSMATYMAVVIHTRAKRFGMMANIAQISKGHFTLDDGSTSNNSPTSPGIMQDNV